MAVAAAAAVTATDTITKTGKPRTCRVHTARQVSYPDPLAIRVGDVLRVGANDDEWPAFVWCTDLAGKSGWVPERYIAREGDRGTVLRDYEATELEIAEGDVLAILDEEGGWFWCRDARDRYGWVPEENVGPD